MCRIITEDNALDDQDGSFCGTGKAYGPYQATELLADDAEMAKINIENYVWYALVSETI